MTERPIIFSGSMVQAILDGRKTQTRRVIQPQPRLKVYPTVGSQADYDRAYTDPRYFAIPACPYGSVGDLLWVRETFAEYAAGDADHIVYKADYGKSPAKFSVVHYGAVGDGAADDSGAIQAAVNAAEAYASVTWKPSIFMPRAHSRIDLEIISVRAERLQTISEQDAMAEGVWTDSLAMRQSQVNKDHIGAFIRTWNDLNAARGYAWETNPWVWRLEFKRIQ